MSDMPPLPCHRQGPTNYGDPDWPQRVYVTAFKEPFYKGGRVRERVPSWTDRIQYHSLADRSGELLPELLDPSAPETSAHNYHAVNDGLDTSDHSPVFATFTLQARAAAEGGGGRVYWGGGCVDDFNPPLFTGSHPSLFEVSYLL